MEQILKAFSVVEVDKNTKFDVLAYDEKQAKRLAYEFTNGNVHSPPLKSEVISLEKKYKVLALNARKEFVLNEDGTQLTDQTLFEFGRINGPCVVRWYE